MSFTKGSYGPRVSWRSSCSAGETTFEVYEDGIPRHGPGKFWLSDQWPEVLLTTVRFLFRHLMFVVRFWIWACLILILGLGKGLFGSR